MRQNYILRRMQPGEEATLWQLFHGTVHHVNRRDYSPAQLEAWSPAMRDMQAWRARMQAIKPFVALHPEHNSANRAPAQDASSSIVGFADLQPDGLIDFFFVHHAWQGRGVASALMREIEHWAASLALPALHAYVSLTAQAFFAHNGFIVAAEQTVTTRGVEMPNALMRRELINV